MTLILSGVGGSTNWLPLVLPLLGVVIILKFGEIVIQFIKRKKKFEYPLLNANFCWETRWIDCLSWIELSLWCCKKSKGRETQEARRRRRQEKKKRSSV